MRREHIEEAAEIEKKIKALEAKRKEWANVDLTICQLPEEFNHGGRVSQCLLPSLTTDVEMHAMLVQEIVNEYDSRIRGLKADLIDLGVELSSH